MRRFFFGSIYLLITWEIIYGWTWILHKRYHPFGVKGVSVWAWYVLIWMICLGCWISSFCLFIRIWPIFSLHKRFLHGLLIWVNSQTIQWGHNILLWYASTRYTLSKDKEGLANNNSQTINNINNQHYPEYKRK